jgi:outer membrane protein
MRTGAFVFVLTTVIIVSAAMAEMKIGIVNSSTIINKYEGFKEGQEKINKETAKWDQSLSDKYKEIRKLKEQLDQRSLVLSVDRKKELQDSIANKETQARQEEQRIYSKNGEIDKRNVELSKPIVEKINRIIEKIAKDENFDMIIDSYVGGVIYAMPKYDLTERVIMLLNKEK